ncbi:MAG: class I SAM-dependent methyltransferase [Candidatus Omnitrophica bacterium]|nr:class I SAM-dependent methyltransferase [Candidatus Omnitrophota bacterium]
MKICSKSVIDKYSQPEELKEYSDIADTGLDKAEGMIISKYFKEKGIILDAGCGGGREAVTLFKEGHKVIGIDIYPWI